MHHPASKPAPVAADGVVVAPSLELSLLLPLDDAGRCARALASLAQQSLPRDRYEIIGVSLGGAVPQPMMSELDSCLCLPVSGPKSRARGLNRAVRMATGRVIALCDSAAEFPAGFAECLATSFRNQDPRARQPVVTLSAPGPNGATTKQALALYRQDAQQVIHAGDPDTPLEDVAWLLVESGAQHLRLDAAAESGFAPGIDWRDIPVFVINRNRHEAMTRLVEWLLTAGTRKVVILDNGSTYPPLLDYYARLPQGASVMRLTQNFGPYVLWEQGVHHVLETPFIVTDSDIVPASFCPSDLIARLLEVMRRYPDATKVGPALRIDNLPDDYTDVDTVRKWESKFWEKPLAPGIFAAPVDTTFALYPPKSEFSLDDRSLRLGYPYIVEHTPWYARESSLSDEERYYREHTSSTFSHWSVRGKTSRSYLSQRVEAFEHRAKVLNIDDSGEYIPGWINAGDATRPRDLPLDLPLDLRRCRGLRLPLADAALDGIRIHHALEDIDDIAALLTELRRVSRVQAKLQVRAASTTGRVFQGQAGLEALLGVAAACGWALIETRHITDKQQFAQRLQGSRSSSASPVLAVVLTLVAGDRAGKPGVASNHQPAPVLVSDDRLAPQFVVAGGDHIEQAEAHARQTHQRKLMGIAAA